MCCTKQRHLVDANLASGDERERALPAPVTFAGSVHSACSTHTFCASLEGQSEAARWTTRYARLQPGVDERDGHGGAIACAAQLRHKYAVLVHGRNISGARAWDEHGRTRTEEADGDHVLDIQPTLTSASQQE